MGRLGKAMVARLIVRMLASFLTHRNYTSQVLFNYFLLDPGGYHYVRGSSASHRLRFS
jgi:hypothetical protein